MSWVDALKLGVAFTIPTVVGVVVGSVMRAAFDYFLFSE